MDQTVPILLLYGNYILLNSILHTPCLNRDTRVKLPSLWMLFANNIKQSVQSFFWSLKFKQNYMLKYVYKYLDIFNRF
ncbi:hypothetical protein NQ317_009990 [Molorchus minor]|uniref:Uncharacterized protein n=1 Tax=Molorchus minor TaxID=1323400 RepID=A0ABQ9K765_9CUCU|nr:hypothetical protein NQ317_009990 [Molorchus minor]